MSPFCTSWPDLKHTVIQQIFIKRLFVQGTSGEGGLQPGPLPRPTPSAVTPGGRSPPYAPEGPAAQEPLCWPAPEPGCRPPGLRCGHVPSPAAPSPSSQALRADGTATLGGLLHLLGKRGPVAALKGELPPLQPQALAAALTWA